MSMTHREWMRRCIEECKTRGRIQAASSAERLLEKFAGRIDETYGQLSKEIENVESTGFYKNASAFGFSPDADGDTNSAALQAAVDGGGTIVVDKPGVYDVSKSCMIGDNTTLLFGAGVYLNRVRNADGVYAAYPFYNANLRDNTGNKNIRINGLHLITNGLGLGSDIASIHGMRGQLAFGYVENLTISDFEVLDGTNATMYNIHIQVFKNITLENITIVSDKDGIHLSCGNGFAIRNVRLLTKDDGIALNAHDYPFNLARYGWIENGIVENVHFMASPDYPKGRGLYLLGGSWKDWESGMSVRKYGDACVSNGRIYRTVGEIDQSRGEIVSTVQPDHAHGSMTYSDGVTWLMAQDGDVIYNCGVRNVVFRDIHFSRPSASALTINMDNDAYSRGYYPNTEAPVFSNITLQNVVTDVGVVDDLISCVAPTKGLRVRDCTYNANVRFAYFNNVYGCKNFGDDTLLIDGSIFELTASNNGKFITAGSDRPVKLKISGNIGHTHPLVIPCNVAVKSDHIGRDTAVGVNLWDVGKRVAVRQNYSASATTVPNNKLAMTEFVLNASRGGIIGGLQDSQPIQEHTFDGDNITFAPKSSGLGLLMPIEMEAGAIYELKYTADNANCQMALVWYDDDMKYVGNTQFKLVEGLTYGGKFIAPDHPHFAINATINMSGTLPDMITFSDVSIVKVVK